MASPGATKWSRFNQVFALKYDLGYRYLDVCGAMMVALEETFGCIPMEQKPTMAKLEQPDLGVQIEIDTLELRVKQEADPAVENDFLPFVTDLSVMVMNFIDPAIPYYSGFAGASFRTYENEERVHDASLRASPEAHLELAAELGLNPQSQAFTHIFTSGSLELSVGLKEVSITSTQKKRHTVGFKPTSRETAAASRRNKAADRSPSPFASLGLLLDVDLRERNPVTGEFSNQYELFRKFEEKMQKRYNV